jgi:hypothetical protein
MTTAVAATYVLPAVIGMLPGTGASGSAATTGNAGQQIWAAEPFQAPGPWTGFAVHCLFVAALLGAGGWLLDRRDA